MRRASKMAQHSAKALRDERVTNARQFALRAAFGVRSAPRMRDTNDARMREASGPTPHSAESPAMSSEASDEQELSNPEYYLNRELGWLAFNERVLDQARDRS